MPSDHRWIPIELRSKFDRGPIGLRVRFCSIGLGVQLDLDWILTELRPKFDVTKVAIVAVIVATIRSDPDRNPNGIRLDPDSDRTTIEFRPDHSRNPTIFR